MNEILALTLHALRGDMARLDTVAMNQANANTPGYKREVPALAFAQRVEGALADATRMDLRQGTLKSTGQALDLALSGGGWFEVMTEHGPAYTRQGNFRADARGRLVTEQGHPVMGQAGEILLPQGTAHIDAQGRVFEGHPAGAGTVARTGEAALAQLRIVAFGDGASPERAGAGLVRFHGAAAQPADPRTEVRQGHLENSNVSAMDEMVQLLRTLRHFESVQKATTGYDEMLGGAIRRLGENA